MHKIRGIDTNYHQSLLSLLFNVESTKLDPHMLSFNLTYKNAQFYAQNCSQFFWNFSSGHADVSAGTFLRSETRPVSPTLPQPLSMPANSSPRVRLISAVMRIKCANGASRWSLTLAFTRTEHFSVAFGGESFLEWTVLLCAPHTCCPR